MSEASETVGRTGRGFLWIVAAKLYFIVTGYGVALALPRLLTKQAFGLYSLAFNNMSIVNNVLIVSTLQTVSKVTSESGIEPKFALRQSLVLQMGIGLGLGLTCLLAGPWFAESVLRNTNVGVLLQVSAAVPLSYALYAAIVGYLNGCQRFSGQAKLDISFSTLRTVAMILGAALGFGALGTISGYAIASSLVLLVALVAVGIGSRGPAWPLSRYLAFMAPIVFYQVCLNGVLLVDVNVLTRTATELALASGHEKAEAETLAENLCGLYRAAQTFAFVPYQLNLSLTLVIFPMVSKATSSGDLETTREHIRRALRGSLLLLLGIAAPMSGASDGVMRLAYTSDYLVASGALQILVLGVVFFALFVACATVLSGAGKPRVAALCAATSLGVVIFATRTFLVRAGIDHEAETLRALALGTTTGMFVGALCAGVATYASFRALVSPWTVLRVLLASGAGYFVADVIPHPSRIAVLASLAVGFFAFVGVLIATRELTGTDLALARNMILRRKKKPVQS